MYPSQSAAIQMTEIRQLRDHYGLLGDLWTSFTQIAGDPGEDLRLLAVLSANVVSAALERAVLPDGASLSAVQASHVGLIYNLAKRIQHPMVHAKLSVFVVKRQMQTTLTLPPCPLDLWE